MITQPNLSIALAFVRALTGRDDTEVTIQTFDDDAGRKKQGLTQIRGGAVSDLWLWICGMQAQGAGVFITVNASEPGKRKASDITGFRALWVEFDRKGRDDKWNEPQWHLPPSVVVRSKNGLHAYWCLSSQPGASWAADFRTAQKRLIARYDSDPAIHDAPRVMRLPGTLHLKAQAEPFLVDFVRPPVDGYPVDAVCAGLPIVGKKATAAPQPKASFASIPKGNPGDFATLDLVGLFRAAGMYLSELGGDKHAVACPFVAGHTDGLQGASSTVIWQTGGKWPTFHCSHAHCKDADLLAVVAHFGVATVSAHCQEPYRRPRPIQPPGADESFFGAGSVPLADTTTAGLLFPVIKADGTPEKDHIANTRALLKFYGWRPRRNLMTHRLELGGAADHLPADMRNNAALAIVENRASESGLSRACIAPHLIEIAEPYHPIREWLQPIVWDGLDHIGALFSTLTLAEPQTAAFSRLLLERWMTGAVAAAFDWPGFAAQGVLTLQGPQGKGKSRWVGSLVPQEYRHCVRSALLLDPHERDSVQRATECWIAELAEIDATFRKADRAALKAFLTAPDDTFREAYAKASETRRRRAVYVATVNPQQFLGDDEDRRYWPLSITAATADHAVDVAQAWAQALAGLRAGAAWWLTSDEQETLARRNDDFRPEDQMINKLWTIWERDPYAAAPLSVICDSVGAVTPGEARKVAAELVNAGVTRDRRQEDGRRSVFWGLARKVAPAISDRSAYRYH